MPRHPCHPWLRLAVALAVVTAAALMAAAASPELPRIEPAKKLNLRDPIIALACSPDGRSGACYFGGRLGITAFNPNTGDVGERLFGADAGRLEYTPDGKYLVALGMESVVWDVAAGRVQDRLTLPPFKVLPPPLKADGTPDLRLPAKAPPQSTAGPVLAPTGGRIYTRDANNNVVVRDFINRKDVAKLPIAGELLKLFAVSPDGTKLAVVTDKTLSVWDTGTLKRLTTIKLGHWVQTVAFCADNKSLFGYGGRLLPPGAKPDPLTSKRYLLLWDTAKGELVRTVDGTAFLNDSTRLIMWPTRIRVYLCGHDTGPLTVVDPAKAEVLGTINAEFSGKLAFTADGKTIVSTCTRDRSLRWVEVVRIHAAIQEGRKPGQVAFPEPR